jgi:hypothetical protein
LGRLLLTLRGTRVVELASVVIIASPRGAAWFFCFSQRVGRWIDLSQSIDRTSVVPLTRPGDHGKGLHEEGVHQHRSSNYRLRSLAGVGEASIATGIIRINQTHHCAPIGRIHCSIDHFLFEVRTYRYSFQVAVA